MRRRGLESLRANGCGMHFKVCCATNPSTATLSPTWIRGAELTCVDVPRAARQQLQPAYGAKVWNVSGAAASLARDGRKFSSMYHDRDDVNLVLRGSQTAFSLNTQS